MFTLPNTLRPEKEQGVKHLPSIFIWPLKCFSEDLGTLIMSLKQLNWYLSAKAYDDALTLQC